MANEIINAKYNELSEKIPTLTAGTYDLTVDCLDVDNPTLKGFGNILKTAQEGVYFNITPTNIGEAITDTSNMFSECKNLTSIDTSNFLNVTNATNMLSYCDNLEKVIWGGSFRPTTNNDMFFKINKLVTIIASIDSEKWIADNATSMSLSNYNLSYDFDLFKYHLDDLNVKSAELRKDRDSWKKKAEEYKKLAGVIELKYSELDQEIPKLQDNNIYDLTIDTTGVDANEFKGSFNTETGEKANSPLMLKLSSAPSGVKFRLTLSIPDTVTDATMCFAPKLTPKGVPGASNLLSINITNKSTNIQNTTNMFAMCSNLTSIDTKVFTNVTNANSMFGGCSSLTSIDTTAFTNVTNATEMFASCGSLTEVTGTSGFTSVTDASYMFSNCSSLTNVDTSGFTSVTNARYMFWRCSSLTEVIGTSAFTKVTNADGMFAGCNNLTSITWGDSFRPTSFNNMFNGATAAKTIYASADSKAWIESNAGNMKLTNYTIVLK